MNRYKTPVLKKVLMVLLIIGFACMEFPGVFFFKETVRPFLFGLPFTYGYILILWAFMCIVLFIAHKANWGDTGKVEKKEGR